MSPRINQLLAFMWQCVLYALPVSIILTVAVNYLGVWELIGRSIDLAQAFGLGLIAAVIKSTQRQ